MGERVSAGFWSGGSSTGLIWKDRPSSEMFTGWLPADERERS